MFTRTGSRKLLKTPVLSKPGACMMPLSQPWALEMASLQTGRVGVDKASAKLHLLMDNTSR